MKKRAFSFILFGGTGDLVLKKIIPSLVLLVDKGVFPKNTPIIGVGRRDFDDDSYKKFLIKGSGNKSVKKLNIKYFKADFSKKGGVQGLEKKIEKSEGAIICNRIYHLATSFKFFPNIVSELKLCCLVRPKDCFSRIIFEKPFGHDLKSSRELDKHLHRVFPEDDIYRIDHYLAKETVQNLRVLKFTNPILTSVLNRKFVESIEIVVDEKLGVGNRLGFYNETGAIKDMIQSHLLQVLSLILMDKPKSTSADDVHNEKVKILKNIVPLAAKNHLIGQYSSYKKEVEKYEIKKLRTETFANVILNCKTPEWDGVKLILRTGKKLPKKYGQIVINFKPVKGIKDSKIIINIQPQQNVVVKMGKSAFSSTIERVNFEFCKTCKFGPNTPDEYSTLINEAIMGNHTLFAREDEVQASWKIVDKLERMRSKMKFVTYKDYSDPEKKS